MNKRIVAKENNDTLLMYDLGQVLKKVKLTDKQKEVLDLWMGGMMIKNIAKELNKPTGKVCDFLDRIVNKIVETYENEIEDWYYLNICKGEYKRCSKCGEVKLINKFNKNGKKGLKPMCKICQ